MAMNRNPIWLALIAGAIGLPLAAILALGIQERDGADPAPGPAAGAIRDAFGPLAQMDGPGRTRATDHARRAHPAEPAGTLGGGRRRW